jgi:hypothetical protein
LAKPPERVNSLSDVADQLSASTKPIGGFVVALLARVLAEQLCG